MPRVSFTPSGFDHLKIARIITSIERSDADSRTLLRRMYSKTGNAFVLGVTGPPGTGKSTLVDGLITEYRNQGNRVGVLAIDPTSPFTGGALLGDRIRMTQHNLDPNVFIRSMATRGSIGGLSRATRNAVRVLDAFGAELVIVETVGIGQGEVDVIKVADATLVVLMPQAGDEIQMLKAGLMEIGDIFVVNKGDLPGADRSVLLVRRMVIAKDGWTPPVVRTIARAGKGLAMLAAEIERFREFLSQQERLEKARRAKLSIEIQDYLGEAILKQAVESLGSSERYRRVLQRVLRRELDPATAAQEFLRGFHFRATS